MPSYRDLDGAVWGVYAGLLQRSMALVAHLWDGPRASERGRGVKRILITGMSAVGKSTVVEALSELGYRAVDLDGPEWSDYRAVAEGPDSGLDWRWKEGAVERLLSAEDFEVLFVSGCAPNQAKFYPFFDRIILLTASEKVTRDRLVARTNNDFGKTEAELAKVLSDKATFEDRLATGADTVIETDTQPLDAVLDRIVETVASE